MTGEVKEKEFENLFKYEHLDMKNKLVFITINSLVEIEVLFLINYYLSYEICNCANTPKGIITNILEFGELNE